MTTNSLVVVPQNWIAIDPSTGEIITDNAPARVMGVHQQLFEALATTCRMLPARKPDGAYNWTGMTRTERGMLNRATKELREAGATLKNVLDFSEWYKRNDWRGKRGDPPLPTDVVKMFTRFLASHAPEVDRFSADRERYKLLRAEVGDDEDTFSAE